MRRGSNRKGMYVSQFCPSKLPSGQNMCRIQKDPKGRLVKCPKIYQDVGTVPSTFQVPEIV